VWARQAAWAGRFYPDDPGRLRQQIQGELGRAVARRECAAKALIVPHAGYVYSASIAASAYVVLHPRGRMIDRVLLLGTCHSPGVDGLAATSAAAFETPLGRVLVDTAAVAETSRLPQVRIHDDVHCRDHALEVQLPFLQVVLNEFRIVPFLVGRADAAAVAELLELLWDGEATVIVVSSDLSHYHSYEEARRIDRATSLIIERLDDRALSPASACGRNAIAGLLLAARRHGLSCRTLDLRNSGDTAGRRDRVVGYGAFRFDP
jgi:AmmeMemoRadiSam system protein B